MSLFKFPNLRLTIKLPMLIVLTALSVAMAACLTASLMASNSSEQLIRNHLSDLAASKRDAIENQLGTMRNDLRGTADNPAVQRMLEKLSIGYKILSAEDRARLPGKYVPGGALPASDGRGLTDFYGSAYEPVHTLFRSYAVDHGYSDILFIDRDGNVVYSARKRGEFARNVHADGGSLPLLPGLFDLMKDHAAGSTSISDFEDYGPARQPILFAATPVYQKLGTLQDFVGVLLFEIPGGSFDQILNAPEGFSDRGEALLVGQDGLLRSNSRFGRIGDILKGRFDLSAPGGPSGPAGGGGTKGDTMWSAAPLGTDRFHWSVVATESVSTAFRPVEQMVISIIMICLIVTLVLTLASVVIARRVAWPVEQLVDRFKAALDNMPHGLAMFDDASRLILCNSAYARLYQLPEELIGAATPLARILEFRQAAGSGPADDQVDPGAGPLTAAYASRSLLADGRTVDMTYSQIPTGGYVTTHEDVTQQISAEARIHHLATHDLLTGLPNRGQLGERLAKALGRLRQGRSLAVFCLDLDHFKFVNDTLGHQIGDVLLQAMTTRLAACLKPSDMLARLGGDEFIVLQIGLASLDEAETLARQLIEAMSEPFSLQGHQVSVGISIGIALAPMDGADPDMLLKKADIALYRAKAEGRGAYRFFETGMDARLQKRRMLELDLKRAFAAGEFEMFYQPIVNAISSEIIGFEALIRWRHPELGMIPPLDFIPIAEEMGLIVPLGNWIIRQACADAVTWPRPVKVAINISPVQFKSPTLSHVVVAALAETGLSPSRLEVEITESVLLTGRESAVAILHHLRSLGIKIAMDDFGTGYSSLSYLRSFPFDKIKIDRSFVMELGTTEDCVAIVKAVAGLGANLGMVTTAEGVETLEQLQKVREQGCDEVQGYYFSAPRPAHEVAGLLGAPVRAVA